MLSSSVALNGAFLGRGRGPWTVQVSVRELVGGRRLFEPEIGAEGWTSRYEDPDAEATRPVRRKILRRESGSRVRLGLPSGVASEDTKTGADVPPGGALKRRLSAIAAMTSAALA